MQYLAHDIRQFTAAIVGNLDLLEREYALEGRARIDGPVAEGRPREASGDAQHQCKGIGQRVANIRTCLERIEEILSDAVQVARMTTDGHPDLNKIAKVLVLLFDYDGVV